MGKNQKENIALPFHRTDEKAHWNDFYCARREGEKREEKREKGTTSRRRMRERENQFARKSSNAAFFGGEYPDLTW